MPLTAVWLRKANISQTGEFKRSASIMIQTSMRSTFGGFTTAQLGMAASQKALDVTGQNIANINTTGYTRQRLDIASMNLKYVPGRANVGYGVEMTGVSQLRDPFLDLQYRNQMSSLGTTDARAAGLERLQNVFDETQTDGIRAALRDINSALDKLSGEVGNQEFDTMVKSEMQNLVNLFHQSKTSLKEIREDVTSSLKDVDIVQLNKTLENIARLNTQIKNSNALGNPALELQDERNNLLDELSTYLPIKTEYTQKMIGEGLSIEVLNVSFIAEDGKKYALVSDGSYGSFSVETQGDQSELFITDANTGGYENLTSVIGEGTLKGTLDFLNKSGSLDNSDFKGIGYYEKVLDSLVDTFAKTFNALNRAPVIGKDGKVVTNPDGTPQMEDRPLFETSDKSADFTAENIKIADGWNNDTYGITASVVVGSDGKIASSANDNIINMINALKEERGFSVQNGNTSATTFFNGSFYDCYANIESTLGIDIKSVQTTLDNQISVVNQTANSRDSVSGVQLDEEGMNLLHYQQSYSAAARLMTTLNDILDTLINKTAI